MLVRMVSDLYYDTPVGTIGYVIRKLHHDCSDEVLLLVRFMNGEEECAWKYDLEIIQEIKND
tara:strand:- start:152 stop:337 length:186 start_codon:yes stop_codon:yes gene_type:complete